MLNQGAVRQFYDSNETKPKEALEMLELIEHIVSCEDMHAYKKESEVQELENLNIRVSDIECQTDEADNTNQVNHKRSLTQNHLDYDRKENYTPIKKFCPYSEEPNRKLRALTESQLNIPICSPSIKLNCLLQPTNEATFDHELDASPNLLLYKIVYQNQANDEIKTVTKPKDISTVQQEVEPSKLSSHISLSNQKVSTNPAHEKKFVDVVRNKKERESLQGHHCEECKAFYTLYGKMLHPDDDLQTVMNKFSRHRHRYLPPETPPGYWDLGTLPPDEPN